MRARLDTIEADYQANHQVGGIAFVAIPPDRYASDDDNAVFTGMYLAGASYRYAVRGSNEDFQAVRSAVAGIHTLTHVSGTPGVLARWAFPVEGAWERIGYDPVKSPESEGNTYGDHIRSGRLYEHDGYAFLTKTTRDQLSGVLFGLTAAWIHVPLVRSEVAVIVDALITRLRATDWSLVDHMGKTGTSAHRADSGQRLILTSLHNPATGPGERGSSLFLRYIWLTTIHYNRIITRTFSFSLNAMDAHSLFLLSDYHKEGKGAVAWVRRLQCFMRKDRNPYFDALHYAATGEEPHTKSRANWYRRIQENYPGFFSWQKDPESWWRKSDKKVGPGIDAMLPYWVIEHTRAKVGDEG